jgi:hypothetical protein
MHSRLSTPGHQTISYPNIVIRLFSDGQTFPPNSVHESILWNDENGQYSILTRIRHIMVLNLNSSYFFSKIYSSKCRLPQAILLRTILVSALSHIINQKKFIHSTGSRYVKILIFLLFFL